MLSYSDLQDKIIQLDTKPRRQEDEYEYTSDLLEWMYQNIYRAKGESMYPELYLISKDPKYNTIIELCKKLMNYNYSKSLEEDVLIQKYESLKKMLLELVQQYDEPTLV
jgi:hypothetical protein